MAEEKSNNRPKIMAAIPAYNEEKYIGTVVLKTRQYVDEVIVVDDGIATGATMGAAIISVKVKGAKKIVVAVPVAPPDTLEKIKQQVDKVICLHVPEILFGVGAFFDNFAQTEDETVIKLMGYFTSN